MLLPLEMAGKAHPAIRAEFASFPTQERCRVGEPSRRIVNDVLAATRLGWSLPCAKRTRNAASPLFVTQA
jgi:hypothetical protein